MGNHYWIWFRMISWRWRAHTFQVRVIICSWLLEIYYHSLWMLQGLQHGEFGTLEIIKKVWQNVKLNTMPETRQNLKGVTNRPLIDDILVSNFILFILHIIIGWKYSSWCSDERVGLLDIRQAQTRNALFMYLHETSLAQYESWLENDSILLNDNEFNKWQFKID
jgi:hypothetical protein